MAQQLNETNNNDVVETSQELSETTQELLSYSVCLLDEISSNKTIIKDLQSELIKVKKKLEKTKHHLELTNLITPKIIRHNVTLRNIIKEQNQLIAKAGLHLPHEQN